MRLIFFGEVKNILKSTNLSKMFNFEIRDEITADDINKYSSTFIIDALNPSTKDLFEVFDLDRQDDALYYKAKITQQKNHPYSDGGFHLSAITATEIILSVVNTELSGFIKGFRLVEHQINCEATVRSKEPHFRVKAEALSTDIMLVHFNVEESSYFGSLKFFRLSNSTMASGLATPAYQANGLAIKGAKLDGKKLSAKIEMHPQKNYPLEFDVSPCLLLSVLSQLFIVQLYAISTANEKQSGVVLIRSIISWDFFVQPLHFCGVNMEVSKLRLSESKKNHVIAEVDFAGDSRGFSGNALYFFEPM